MADSVRTCTRMAADAQRRPLWNSITLSRSRRAGRPRSRISGCSVAPTTSTQRTRPSASISWTRSELAAQLERRGVEDRPEPGLDGRPDVDANLLLVARHAGDGESQLIELASAPTRVVVGVEVDRDRDVERLAGLHQEVLGER